MLNNLQQIPLDQIFQLQADYLKDPNPAKVNLGIGLYADEKGDPVVLEVVKEAFLEVDVQNFNYQPIGGNAEFLSLTAKLLFGEDVDLGRLAMQATVGGTQAISSFAKIIGARKLLIGKPTWPNHLAIFKDFETVEFEHLTADYEVNFEGYKKALEESEVGSVLLLHGGQTHNPTGRNLTIQQLEDLAEVANKKEIMVFVDSAYFGFGESFEAERECLKRVLEIFDKVAVAFSYSKNASLYEHRTGALFMKTDNKLAVESHLQQISRETVSMAPGIGQEVMANILKNKLRRWEKEVDEVRKTLDERRDSFIKRLPGRFAARSAAKGMFLCLPLSKEDILEVRQKYAVYMPLNGRVNVAGINSQNLEYVTKCLGA